LAALVAGTKLSLKEFPLDPGPGITLELRCDIPATVCGDTLDFAHKTAMRTRQREVLYDYALSTKEEILATMGPYVLLKKPQPLQANGVCLMENSVDFTRYSAAERILLATRVCPIPEMATVVPEAPQDVSTEGPKLDEEHV